MSGWAFFLPEYVIMKSHSNYFEMHVKQYAAKADVLKALACGIRWQMLARLQTGPLGVGDLAEALCVTPSTISHHLDILHHVSLINREKTGQQVICRLTSVAQQLCRCGDDVFACLSSKGITSV